jgi:tripartite-type tricarboxylate transporter receptor subunit TctC
MFHRHARLLAMCLLTLGAFGPAAAQSFLPNRPVTLIVPYTPGGVTDLYARAVSAKLAERWHQPVNVENRGGAGTVIGTQAAATAAPDGHTLLLASYAFTSNQVLMKKLPYEPSALVPLLLLGTSTNMLVVNPQAPVTDLKSVIALARSAPGALKLASSGNGSSPHIAAELFAATVGADITHVPYKGTAPAMNDVYGGQLHGIFDGPSSMHNVRAGKLRAIAVASAERHPFAMEVPTFRELGIDFVFGSWFGFFVPKDTPPALQKKIYDDLRAVIEMPETRAQIGKGGLRIQNMTQAEFKAFLDAELAKLRGLVDRAGSKFQIE